MRLPLNPKDADSNQAKVMDFPFRWEVKLEAPCHRILWHVKEPCVG
jgi:hypothetical protein